MTLTEYLNTEYEKALSKDHISPEDFLKRFDPLDAFDSEDLQSFVEEMYSSVHEEYPRMDYDCDRLGEMVVDRIEELIRDTDPKLLYDTRDDFYDRQGFNRDPDLYYMVPKR